MNVSLEKVGELSGKIVVNVVKDDYAKEFDKQIKEIGRTHNFPGFRPGHVPAGMVIRRFGRDVKSDIINNAVYKEVVKFIEENKLPLLGQPMPVEVKEITMEQADFTFEYEIGMSPEINIDLTAETMPFYTITVSDEMVKEQDAALRERFGAQVQGEEVTEKAVVKGTIQELDADGKIKEGEDAIQVVDGSLFPYYFSNKEEAAKFAGKKVGDKVVFNPAATCDGNAAELASMLRVSQEQAAAITSDFEFAIAEITVVKPAENGEEFFNNAFGKDNVKNEEEYIEAIKKMIANQLAPNSETLFRIQSEKQLVEKYGNVELPVEFLKKWLVATNKELTAENIDAEFEKMLPSLKWEIIKGKLEEALEIKVEEADMLSFAKMIAAQQFAQYGMTGLTDDIYEDYAKRMLEDKNYRSRIFDDVVNSKLFRAIQAKVNLDKKNVTLDEFKAVAEEAQK